MSSELDHHLSHLIPWYCVPNMLTLLEEIGVENLSSEQIQSLKTFDFHYFPQAPMRSITFLNGNQAVKVIEGVADGRWTKEDVKQRLRY